MNMKQIHPLKLKFKIHLVEKPALGCFFILSPCYYLKFLNTQGKDGSQGPSGSGGVKGDKVNL